MNVFNTRVIITTITYFVIIAVGIVFVIRPLMARVQVRQIELQNEYQKYKTSQQKLKQLTDLTNSRDDIQNAKVITTRAIPPTLDQDRLLLSLEKVVSDAGLKITTLTVAAAATAAATPQAAKGTAAAKGKAGSDKLNSVQSTINVTGKYADLISVFDTLEKLDRVITINNVSITNSTTAGSGDINGAIQVTAYAGGTTP